MAFFMFFVTQMIRSNLYIAIVAMVETKQQTTDLTKPFFNPEVRIRPKPNFHCSRNYLFLEITMGLKLSRYNSKCILLVLLDHRITWWVISTKIWWTACIRHRSIRSNYSYVFIPYSCKNRSNYGINCSCSARVSPCKFLIIFLK